MLFRNAFLGLFIANSSIFGGIKRVDVTPVTVPVMINRAYNKVIGLNVVTDQKPVKLSAFIISLKGSSYKTIEAVTVYKSIIDEKNGLPRLEGVPGEVVATAKGSSINKKNGIVVLKSDFMPVSGNNHFWISVTVSEKASLSGRISLAVKAVKSGAKAFQVKNAQCVQRIGYAITVPSQEVSIVKPETGALIEKRISKYFRIPGLAKTKKGSLIAVFDNRYHHNGDLPADIDVAIRRSTNGGQTWSPIITTIAARDIPGIGHGCGDPAILVDNKTGRIWIAGLAAPKTGHPIWNSVTGSASPADCGQFVLSYSDDDGKTWSKPINITESIKRLDDPDTKEWGCLFQGPGNGICMKNGTLVFPAQIWGKRHMGVLVYSKDRGKTWTSSNPMEFGGSECQVAELSDGSLMLNCREGAGGKRQVGVTKDLGKTWEKHASVNSKKGELRQPVCQACLISTTNVMGEKHALFFSNPNSHTRKDMTIKYSTDDGDSWSEGLLYDQRHGMGYSAIIRMGKNDLGVFYEGEHHYLYFLRIPFKEIMK